MSYNGKSEINVFPKLENMISRGAVCWRTVRLLLLHWLNSFIALQVYWEKGAYFWHNFVCKCLVLTISFIIFSRWQEGVATWLQWLQFKHLWQLGPSLPLPLNLLSCHSACNCCSQCLTGHRDRPFYSFLLILPIWNTQIEKLLTENSIHPSIHPLSTAYPASGR